MKNFFIPPVLVLFSLILIILCYFMIPALNIIPFPYNWTGILPGIAGFAIMGKTNELFLKHKTTRAIKKSTQLLTEGPFSKSRNPMYIGMFLFLLGTGICFINLISMLIPVVFIITINFFIIPKEEQLMADAFGQEYDDYKNKVRRWI